MTFSVSAPTIKPATYRLDVTAQADGRTYNEGSDVLAHRDLETRYHYKPAAANFRALNVAIAPNLRVGYVMGVGDELPAAIAQLGATVTLLDALALTSAPLDRFDAIVLGTRAYAVRPDLRAANGRLLDYAKNGGNLIVLYNTPELDPATQAPFPGKLPAEAEEVSEETAAVKILTPQHQVFTRPNRITADDFKGWMEQRGSKFWTRMGRRLHRAPGKPRSRSGPAARRLALRALRQGPLFLRRLRIAPADAVRRPRCVSAACQPAVAWSNVRGLPRVGRQSRRPSILIRTCAIIGTTYSRIS